MSTNHRSDWFQLRNRNHEFPAINESWFEDWFAARIGDVLGENVRLIGQQVRLKSGRIPDLLATDGESLIVVELKAGEITRSAVCQLLEYMGELSEEGSFDCNGDLRFRGNYKCLGVVAAPSISSRAATMLKTLPDVRYVSLVVGMRATVWDTPDFTFGHAAHSHPWDVIDGPFARQLRNKDTEGFVATLFDSGHRFEDRGDHILTTWRGGRFLGESERLAVVAAVRLRLRIAHPGMNNNLTIAP